VVADSFNTSFHNDF